MKSSRAIRDVSVKLQSNVSTWVQMQRAVVSINTSILMMEAETFSETLVC
jgi:hypothetical protein